MFSVLSSPSARGASVATRRAVAQQLFKNRRHNVSRICFSSLAPDVTSERMNLFSAINNAMSIALKTDDSAVVFGEDVAFGGVFRCSQNLREEFGEDRVFNTPLSENGIAGFAIGYASMGGTAIGKLLFTDYEISEDWFFGVSLACP